MSTHPRKVNVAQRLEARRLLAFTPYDGDLVEQTIAGGLDQPVAVEFAPGGRIFVAEKAGRVLTYDSIDDDSASVALDIRPVVNTAADRGLLGLALSPTFASDGHLYALYTFDGDVGGAARTSDIDRSTTNVSGKLSRFTFADGQLADERVLIHDWPAQFSSHTIGHLQFGPDGYLYVGGGDGASFNNVDYGQFGNPFGDPTNEGGALRSQDLLSPGDPVGLDGTIIRIDPATAAGAPGNPYANSADANARRIVVSGMRNPYRFNFRPGTSELWIGDVGWSQYEEINRVTNIGGDTGAGAATNLGWPAWEGPGWQGGYKAAGLPLLAGFYTGATPKLDPYFTYHHGQKVDASSTVEPTGGSSSSGVAFYDAQVYPFEYWDSLWFADYGRGAIYAMRAGADGLPDPTTVRQVQSGVYCVELQAGPNGDMFYVDVGRGAIVRITAKGPKARLTADRTSGPAPLTVNFDASGSTDPDEFDVVSFAWDLDDDGQFDDATGPTATRTYTTAGTFVARVRATDYDGLSDVASASINVDSTAPTPAFATPSKNRFWSANETIKFSGSATDAEDGAVPSTRLRWRFVLMHANEQSPGTPAHEHLLATFDGVNHGSFRAPDHAYPSWIELRLTATDSGGNATTIRRRLNPLTTTVSVGASTPGVRVAFDEDTFVTPFTRTVINGSEHSLSVPPRQAVAGVEWRFDQWQDLAAGANAREFVARAAGGVGPTLHVSGRLQGWRRLDGVALASAGMPPGGSGIAQAFDGDAATGYRSADVNGWLGIDLGAPRALGQITIAPLAGFAMAGGRLEGSGSATFAMPAVLYTFGSTPAGVKAITAADGLATATAFRYVRYVAPAGGYAGVAELSVATAEANAPRAGTPFGSAAIAGSSIANAFDGRIDTTYTATQPSGRWVALDLGAPRTIDVIRFAPQPAAALAMKGGKVQVASRADFSDAITIHTIASTPRVGWNEARVNGDGAWRYVRYYGPNGSSARLADFAVASAPPPPVPLAPGAVGVVTSDATQGVTLAWADRSIVEAGYRVRRLAPGGAWTTLANLPANSATFTDARVTTGATYSYRVIPTLGVVNGGEARATATVVAQSTAPARPTQLAATLQAGNVALEWRDNATNETAYRVERRYTNDAWSTLATLGPGRTSYLDESALAGVSYDYRVTAVNGVGSATSDAVTIAT